MSLLRVRAAAERPRDEPPGQPRLVSHWTRPPAGRDRSRSPALTPSGAPWGVRRPHPFGCAALGAL